MVKLIIDTDPGVDDAMAILFAIAHPEIELVGLTSVFGNVPIDTATRNALNLLEVGQYEAPVAEGASAPLVQPLQGYPEDIHGVDGFGALPPMIPMSEPDPRSAAEFLCEMTADEPGEIVICAVGPFTNLALALEHDPEITENAARIVVMGGAIDGGNVRPWAEANVFNDPHAAEKVFAAPWTVEMLGLDVTEQVICTPADFAAMAEASPENGGFLNDAAQLYFEFHKAQHGFDGCHMHDPTAVIAVLYPEIFGWHTSPLVTLTDGEEVGRTAMTDDPARPGVEIATEADIETVREIFLATMAESDRRMTT